MCYFLRRAHSSEQTCVIRVFSPGAHYIADFIEAMQIQCLAHGHILPSMRIEPALLIIIYHFTVYAFAAILKAYMYIYICQTFSLNSLCIKWQLHSDLKLFCVCIFKSISDALMKF